MKGIQDFHFNISHIHNAIAVAVADSPIGIDIERIRPVNDLIVRRFYSVREQKYVYGTADEVDRRFSEVWTLKEAYIKCNDCAVSLRSFAVDTLDIDVSSQTDTFVKNEDLIKVIPSFDVWMNMTEQVRQKLIIKKLSDVTCDEMDMFFGDVSSRELLEKLKV